ncbi:InlB B-repeat-containing protein, partial [Bifidobacterium amazonense]
MTGNNKVWRAPLAGLASVAMLATMGVAAGTANAQTGAARVDQYKVSVTLHANAPEKASAKIDESDKSTFSLAELDSDNNGTLDELYTADYTLKAPSKNTVFTGWYTKATGGEKFDFANTVVNSDLDLYAHWAASDDIVNFTFNLEGTKSDGTPYQSLFKGANDAYGTEAASARVDNGKSFFSTDGTTYKLSVSKADGKVASWELPTDQPGDQTVVTSWKADPTGAGTYTRTVTNEELTTGFAKALPYDNSGPYNVSLVQGATSKATTVHYLTPGNSQLAESQDVIIGQTVPTDVLVKDPSGVYGRVSQWYYNTHVGGSYEKLPADYKANGNQANLNLYSGATTDVFPVTYWTAVGYDGTGNGYVQHYVSVSIEYVESGKTAVNAPKLTRTNDTLAGWSTSKDFGAAKFDFSTKIYDATNLYAQWNSNKATVTYVYNYSGKKDSQAYVTGQTFTAPKPTRDGRTFLGWYFYGNVDANGIISLVNSKNPFTEIGSSKQGSDFVKAWNNTKDKVTGWNTSRDGNYVGDGMWLESVANSAGAGTYADGAGKTAVQVPAGAKLKFNEDGELQFLATKKTSTPEGVKTTNYWVTISNTLYAAWGRVSQSDLANQENTYWKNDAYEVTSDLYTAASKAAANKVFKEAAELKATLGGADGQLTDDEAAQVEAKLSEGEDLLVQTAPTPVVRLKNGAKHVYSTDDNEQTVLKRNGWKVEGVAFYATAQSAPKSTAVYRLYNPANGNHL